MNSTQPSPVRILKNGFASWSVYDPACKTDLYSHAYRHRHHLIVVDPVMPGAEGIEALKKMGTVTLVLLTNGNHERETAKFRKVFSVPLAVPSGAVSSLSVKPEIIVDGLTQLHGLQPIPLPGAGPGEYAYFNAASKTMIVGDALINAAPKGLSLLPAQYCEDEALTRKSARTLLNHAFDSLFFAHGEPIVGGAKPLLSKLLA
jgi:glyoxylase-like metal-dependent hydrolase (beta-lactamase superfamily II)